MSVAQQAQPPRFRSALITGASRGLGRALALALAREGTAVALVAREREPLLAVRDEILNAGGKAMAIALDVAEEDAATRSAGEAAASLGDLELVVHNASTLGPVPLAPLAEGQPADFTRVLAVNLVAPYALARATLGNMVLRRGGTQLFISSDAASEPYPTWGFYGASKAGLDQLARILAAELKGTGVRVLSVDPGEMDTAMHRDAVPEADPSTLKRPDDVARAIRALLADDNPADSEQVRTQAHTNGSTP